MLLAALALDLSGPVQSLEPSGPAAIEDGSVREDLQRGGGFGRSIIALIDLTNEQELSASHYRIDDDQQTSVAVLSLPYRKVWPLRGEALGLGLYFEGNLGYLRARGSIDDFFGGLPGEESGYEAQWSAYGGLAGVGLRFPVTGSLSLTPILDLSLIHLENDATYNGPASDEAAGELDGLLFNWRATAFGAGGALRLDSEGSLRGSIDYQLIVRYDLRHFETIDSTDEVQQVSGYSDYLTARFEVGGPIAVSLGGMPLAWRTHLGYRYFSRDTADALGFQDFVEVGAALELLRVWSLSRVALRASVLRGADVSGFSLGLGVSL